MMLRAGIMSGLPPVVVKHIYLYAALDAGALTLVECTDGTLRILRDDRPVPDCRWAAEDHEAAASRFRELAARLRRAGGPHGGESGGAG